MPFGQCCPNLGFHCFSNKIGIGMVLVLQGVTIYAIEIQQTNKDLSYAFLDNDGQI